MDLWKTQKDKMAEEIKELEGQIKFRDELIEDFEEGQRRLKKENAELKEQIKALEQKHSDTLRIIQEDVRTMFDERTAERSSRD